MAKLLFRLNNVPEDEAEEVRQLLAENHIDTYETSAGMFGISLAAIWLKDEEQLERAKALIDAYQEERYTRVHGEYEAMRQAGQSETLLDRIIRQPLRMFLFFLAILAVLYLTLMPFIYHFFN